MLMEYVQGGELGRHLRNEGTFANETARFYAAQVGRWSGGAAERWGGGAVGRGGLAMGLGRGRERAREAEGECAVGRLLFGTTRRSARGDALPCSW